MARSARMVGAAGLLLGAGAVVVALAAPGLASTNEATPGGAGSSFASEVSASSWYWAGTSPQVGGTALPASAPSEASNVPAGDRGVAFSSDVDKVTALAFATMGLPAGATFSTFAVRLGLDPAVHQLANGVPALVACEATAPVPANVQGGALAAAPASTLKDCVPGVLDPAKQTYTFELQALATRWAAGSPPYGVVVRPQVGSTTAFSYAFLPDATYLVSARYAAAPVAPAPVSAAPTAAPEVAPPPVEAVLPPASFPVSVSLPMLAAPPAVVAVVAEPVVAPALPVTPPRRPAAVRRVSVAESLRPTAAFWFAGLGLLALLVAAAVILGDPLAPVAPDARRRRFDQVVRARSGSAGSGPSDSGPTVGKLRLPARRPRAV